MINHYLFFDIFHMTVMEMTTSTGSIQQRLRNAHLAYLYKIIDSDIEGVPADSKEKFVELRKIIPGKITEIRNNMEKRWVEFGVKDISKMDPDSSWVYKNLHWKTAQKAARLISEIHLSFLFHFDELHHKTRQKLRSSHVS